MILCIGYYDSIKNVNTRRQSSLKSNLQECSVTSSSILSVTEMDLYDGNSKIPCNSHFLNYISI